MVALYKGKLTLDKVTGIRHDKEQRMTNVKLKASTDLPKVEKSMKSTTNVKKGKWKTS